MYNEAEYAIEEGEGYGTLTTQRVGYYTETIYINSTGNNIMVIDCNNNRTNVPPEGVNTFGARAQLNIMHRYIVGKSLDKNGGVVHMKGFKITIMADTLIDQISVYVPELNVVVCTYDRSNIVSHPYTSMDYGQLLNSAEEEIRKTREGRPTIQFTVNDPYHQLDQDIVYGVFMGEILQIPVTNRMDRSGQCELYATITNGNDVETYHESLDPLIREKDRQEVVELTDAVVLAVAVTRRAAVEFKRDYKRVTEAELTARVKQATETANHKNQNEIISLKNTVEVLKNQVDSVGLERDRYREQYNTIIGARKAGVDLLEHETKAKISENNVKVSDNKVAEAEFKLAHVILAAAAPVAIMAVVKVVEILLKTKTGK